MMTQPETSPDPHTMLSDHLDALIAMAKENDPALTVVLMVVAGAYQSPQKDWAEFIALCIEYAKMEGALLDIARKAPHD